MKRKRIFAKEFRENAREIFIYIESESPQNADKFAQELLNEIDTITANPESYPPVSNFPNKSRR